MTDNTGVTVSPAVGAVDIEGLLELALHMANRADEIAMAGFGNDTREETKSDGSPVTRVDREVETAIRDTIEREHPEAGVLGEEYGEENGVGRWIIDPIDGTREFLDGDPRFSVLIAYELHDESRLGVVSAPALDLRWWAGEGLGARYCYRGVVKAARVSITKRMVRAHGMLLGGLHTNPPDTSKALRLKGRAGAEANRLNRRSVSWEAVRVATGEFDFALSTGRLWDLAPLPVIVREAGGWARVIEQDNGLHHLAVSNPHLAHQVAGYTRS